MYRLVQGVQSGTTDKCRIVREKKVLFFFLHSICTGDPKQLNWFTCKRSYHFFIIIIFLIKQIRNTFWTILTYTYIKRTWLHRFSGNERKSVSRLLLIKSFAGKNIYKIFV